MAIQLHHLLQAIQDCNEGYLDFQNRADYYCFLYNGKWYPCRAIIKRTSELAGDLRTYNTVGAVMIIGRLIPYPAFSEKDLLYEPPPVVASKDEIIDQARLLTEAIQRLLVDLNNEN